MTAASLDLAAIRARVEAATPGPWRKGWLESYNASTGEPEAFVYRLPPDSLEETVHNRIRIRGSESMDCDADAEFIAHACTDVPLLLDAVEELLDALEFCSQQRVSFYTPTGIHMSEDLETEQAVRARAVVAKYRSGR